MRHLKKHRKIIELLNALALDANCNFIIEGKCFQSKQQLFYVNANMNCNVKNCLYVIKCAGCNALYIRETGDFRLRTNTHTDHCRNSGDYLLINICTIVQDKRVLLFILCCFLK